VCALNAILIAVSQEVARGQGDRRFLLVRSGGIYCALPANQVRRIVRGLTCHSVPGGKPHLLGLAQYGGEPLAVLDILALVSGSAPRANNRATVIIGRERRGARTVLGLAVDEALRVATMAEFSDVEPGDHGLLEGTATCDHSAVKLLNTSVLFADEWLPTEDSDA
jgi:chemotaxis signal transduction protein